MFSQFDRKWQYRFSSATCKLQRFLSCLLTFVLLCLFFNIRCIATSKRYFQSNIFSIKFFLSFQRPAIKKCSQNFFLEMHFFKDKNMIWLSAHWLQTTSFLLIWLGQKIKLICLIQFGNEKKSATIKVTGHTQTHTHTHTQCALVSHRS